MDELRAREVLDALRRSAPDAVVLWRGEGLGGRDVDLVVVPGRDHQVARTLRDAGLSPAPQEPGRILWRQWPGETVILDVLAHSAWPTMYPGLRALLAGAAAGEAGLLVATPGHRLLIFAAEAVAGRPVQRLTVRIQTVLKEPGARADLEIRGRGEFAPLARLATALDALAVPHGRLPLGRALRVAARSAPARAALRERAGLAGASLPSAGPRASGRPGVLIALSGMDGSGKSTAALGLVATLEATGRPVTIRWTRLASDLGVLGPLAMIVRRLLRRTERLSATALSEPEAAPTPLAADRSEPRSRLTRLADSAWVLAVAASCVRAARRADRLRGRGLDVVCDRWLLDALVDMRLRYGRRPAAEWVLRRGFPAAEVTVLLDVDVKTALARKPGDQSDAVLRQMAELYPALATRTGTHSIDGRRGHAAVRAELEGRLRSRLDAR